MCYKVASEYKGKIRLVLYEAEKDTETCLEMVQSLIVDSLSYHLSTMLRPKKQIYKRRTTSQVLQTTQLVD
jgi:hypothetical protein